MDINMIIAFIIWSIVSIIFVIVGIMNCHSEKEVGFFTGVRPKKRKDVKAYNRAVARIWFFFAFGLEVSGVPLLFAGQNSPLVIPVILLPCILIIVIMIAYLKVDEKYK